MIVTLVYADPNRQRCVEVELGAGSTLQTALDQTVHHNPFADFSSWNPRQLTPGINGRVRPPSALLKDGDRVEFYRPRRIDPRHRRLHRLKGEGSPG